MSRIEAASWILRENGSLHLLQSVRLVSGLLPRFAALNKIFGIAFGCAHLVLLDMRGAGQLFLHQTRSLSARGVPLHLVARFQLAAFSGHNMEA